MLVIGKQEVNGTNKNTGNAYKGVKLFLTYPLSKGTGEGCTDVYVGDKSSAYADALSVSVGDKIDFRYNRYGNIESVISL